MASISEHFERGFAAHRQGDLDGAAQSYDAALQLDPRHPKALHMRGVVHLQRGAPVLATELIRASLQEDPSEAGAHGNLVSALIAAKQFDAAVEAGRSGVALHPEAVDIWANLATALMRRDSYPEALGALQRALELRPERAGLHSAIGACLTHLERYDEALLSHRRATELAPEKPEYKNNLSVTLRAMKLNAEAEGALRAAIEGGLGDADIKSSLAAVLLRRGKRDEAFEIYRAARGSVRGNSLDSALVFGQNHQVGDSPLLAKADAIDWAARARTGVKPFSDYPNELSVDRPIRVGLVSGDMRVHPVGRYLEASLAGVSPQRLTLFAYSAVDNGDEVNTRLRGMIPNWRSTATRTDLEVAELIRRDGIDVLVDLSGHTAHSRLPVFMYRPAPVAVTWMGFFATTGVAEIDYVLCNDWLLPVEEEPQWVEKPWRLPSAHWCYAPAPDTPDVAPLPALQSGHITFGCYNNFTKLNRHTIAAWCRILESVSGSRLLLRSGNKEEHVLAAVIEAFAENGWSPGERLSIESSGMSYAEHMGSYGRVDIALDPFPYNGGTTTTEALYMGVPVLTLHGDRFVAHMSESNIRSVGLDDWVATSVDDYTRRAIEFSADVPALAALRRGLRDRAGRSKLFDPKAFAGDLEQAFTGMWAKWVNGQTSLEER